MFGTRKQNPAGAKPQSGLSVNGPDEHSEPYMLVPVILHCLLDNGKRMLIVVNTFVQLSIRPCRVVYS